MIFKISEKFKSVKSANEPPGVNFSEILKSIQLVALIHSIFLSSGL